MSQDSEEVLDELKWYRNTIFPTYNSILFLVFGFVLLNYYGIVHWQIIGMNHELLDGELKSSLFKLMGKLESYRLCGLVALLFSVWGCFCRPRWAIIINVLLGLVSCFMIIVTM